MNIAKLLKLRWTPPETDVDGSVLDGPIRYEVQFTSGENAVTVETLEPHLEIYPLDHGLTPGIWEAVTYSIELEDGQELRSTASNLLTIELTETSPPKPPTDLRLDA